MRAFEDYEWRDILTADMEHVYSAYHRDRAIAARPALIVVHPRRDFRATARPDWAAAAARIVADMRARHLPVIHSVPRGDEPYSGIDIQPTDGVCARPCESAFFFSDLAGVLTRGGASGVIICGAPTSGAVRATAVEAKSYGYRTAIAEETVGDEAALLHRVALFDVAHKYADVISLNELQLLLQMKADV